MITPPSYKSLGEEKWLPRSHCKLCIGVRLANVFTVQLSNNGQIKSPNVEPLGRKP